MRDKDRKNKLFCCKIRVARSAHASQALTLLQMHNSKATVKMPLRHFARVARSAHASQALTLLQMHNGKATVKMPLRHFARVAGFTLIEVIVSIALLSLLMAYVYTIVSDSMNTKEVVSNEDREFIQIQSALSRIEIDFMQIYSPLYYEVDQADGLKIKKEMQAKNKQLQQRLKQKDRYKKGNEEDQNENEENNNNQESKDEPYRPTDKFPKISTSGKLIPIVRQPKKTSLIFFTAANRRKLENSKQSQYSWVKYSLDSAKQSDENLTENRLVRQFSAINPYTGEFEWDKVKKHTLAINIKTIKFEFWEPTRKKYVDSLELLGEKLKLHPSLLKITLTWKKSTGSIAEEILTVKPLWPIFDTQKSEREKWKAPKKNTIFKENEGESEPVDNDEK